MNPVIHKQYSAVSRSGFGRMVVAACLLAAAGCFSPRPHGPAVDPEIADMNNLARTLFDRGSVAEASQYYRRALNRARAVDDARELASAAYNLAACHLALGEFDQARSRLREARDEFARVGENPADLWLMEAKTAQRQGNLDEVGPLTDRAEAALGDAPEPDLRIQLIVLRGNVACERGNLDQARAELTRARRLANKKISAAVAAGLAELSGEVLLLEQAPAPAAVEFDRETALRRRIGHYADMGMALARAGEAYREAGNSAAAADRYFRASRSMFALGNKIGALKMVEKAMDAADVSDDPSVRRQATLLYNEMIAEPGGKAAVPEEDDSRPAAADPDAG